MPRRAVPVRPCVLLLLASALAVQGLLAAPPEPPLVVPRAPFDRNLLRNAGFEAGTDTGATSWDTRLDPTVSPPPAFTRGRDAHEGQRCAEISSAADNGRHELVQVVDDAPRSASVARLTGWIRVAGPGARETDGAEGEDTGAAACLVLSFPEAAQASAARSFQSAELPEGSDWSLVDLEVPVPPGARAWTVSCSLRGAGRACFDDLRLTVGDSAVELASCVLALSTSRYYVEAQDEAPASWIAFSVPFPFEGQLPLALWVTSDPPGAIDRLELRSERENRPLRVMFKPLHRGQSVRLRAESLVLLRDRPLSDGAGIKLPAAPRTPTAAAAAARKLPSDVSPHLQTAPGIVADDPTLADVAHGFSQHDLAGFSADLHRFLEYRLANTDAGRKVRGVNPIDTNMTLSAQYANLAASLLIANGVPARILACTGVSGPLQEHYLVEAWTTSLGWSRFESTAAFPWGDTRNVVLRVVYPDAPRTQKNVPTWCIPGPGIIGYPNFAPETLFWQSGRLLGTFAAESADLERLQSAARASFGALVEQPAAGLSLRFVPDAATLAAAAAAAARPGSASATAPALGERCSRLLEVIEAQLRP